MCQSDTRSAVCWVFFGLGWVGLVGFQPQKQSSFLLLHMLLNYRAEQHLENKPKRAQVLLHIRHPVAQERACQAARAKK